MAGRRRALRADGGFFLSGFVGGLFGGGSSNNNTAQIAQQQALAQQQADDQRVSLARQQQTLENTQAQQDLQLGKGVRVPVGRRLLLAATGEQGLSKTL